MYIYDLLGGRENKQKLDTSNSSSTEASSTLTAGMLYH